jgi:hypothetical protein
MINGTKIDVKLVRGCLGELNMSPTAEELYTSVIRTLSPIDRLQLATLILNGLVEQNVTPIDISDNWTEQDRSDITNFSLQYAAFQINKLAET